MATIRGPKHKICRTVGYCIYSSPKCPSIKRPFPPGQRANARRKKRSSYAEQLLEKQKLRLTYGMMEKQFFRTFQHAVRTHGNTADNFMIQLESRLMTVVNRMGLARSIFDARQLINHGHVTVNGKRVDIPSFHVRVNDIIGLMPSSAALDREKMGMDTRTSSTNPVPYLEIQSDGISAKFLGIQSVADVPVTRINVQKIVEYYSR